MNNRENQNTVAAERHYKIAHEIADSPGYDVKIMDF
jgi:hypothetical protein